MCTKNIEVKSKKGHSKANPEEMIFFYNQSKRNSFQL